MASAGEFTNSDEFVNSSENVSVWQRSALPLRVDASAGETRVDVPDTIVNVTTLEDGEGTLNKRTLAVFNTGSTIPIEFQKRAAANTTRFSGEDVQLVIARLNESESLNSSDVSANRSDISTNMTTDEAIDLLMAENLSSEEANSNFTFYSPKSGNIDSEGAVSFSFSPDEPGQYAFVLVASDNGDGDAVSVSQGNLSLTNDTRILGVDGAPVQKTSASATPNSETVDPGENITFSVDSNLDAEEVNHTVAVFNESKLADQSSTVTIDDEIDSNLSAENVTVEHSVEAVDGVARIEDNSEVMGVNLSDETVDRSVTIASVIDSLANETDRETPETTATDDVVLNASVTSVVNVSNTTTIDVGTSKNWTNGTYTYVYIAGTNNSSEFSTTKGSVTVGKVTEEKTKVQLNLTANRTTVTVDEAIKLTVTRPNGAAVSGATVTIDGETVTTDSNGQVVIRPSSVGELTASVTKPATSTSEFLPTTIDITAEAADTSGGGDGGGGGGGQGGDGGSGDADPVETSDGATVNFRNTQGGQPISVDLPDVSSENTAVTGMEITTKFAESDFRVEYTDPQSEPPAGAPPLDDGEAAEYFTAEAIGIDDDRIDNVNFTFTLSESEIPEDRPKSDVRLFRYVDGEWVALETTHLGGDRYRAKSPGFTAYAIGVQSAQQTDTPTDTITPTETPTETATPTVTATDTATEPPGTDTETPGEGGADPVLIGVLLVLLLLLGVGIYLYNENA